MRRNSAERSEKIPPMGSFLLTFSEKNTPYSSLFGRNYGNSAAKQPEYAANRDISREIESLRITKNAAKSANNAAFRLKIADLELNIPHFAVILHKISGNQLFRNKMD